MICEACKRGEVLAHVHLTYDVPLAARGWTVKVGGTLVSKFDIKETWDRLVVRPLFCHSCGQGYVYDAARNECNAVNVSTMREQVEAVEAQTNYLRDQIGIYDRAREAAEKRVKELEGRVKELEEELTRWSWERNPDRMGR